MSSVCSECLSVESDFAIKVIEVEVLCVVVQVKDEVGLVCR